MIMPGKLTRKVESARNALLVAIHDRALAAGDRLPSYAQLRQELGVGSQTISAAVDLLCGAGVLEVRDKVGIFVKDPAGSNLAGRTVAVAVRQLEGSSYAATLAGFIQKRLIERNCRCATFYQQSGVFDRTRPALDDFPGLEQAANERRIDGVITLCPLSNSSLRTLKKLKVHVCFVGDDNESGDMPLAVVLEVRRFMAEGARALRTAGCKRLAQICVSAEQLDSRRDWCDEPGEPLVTALIGRSFEGGAAIARQLLAIRRPDRPDGIVCDDDTIVTGMLSELVARQLPEIRYLPQVATLVHKELGEHYPSNRVILFEQDIQDYVDRAIELLLCSLRNQPSPARRIACRLKRVSP